MRSLVVVLAGLLAIAVLVVGVGWWSVQRAFPDYTGRVAVAGLDDTVTVARDASGIPTITATTDHDLFFTQGYVHAQDRFWEMDFRRHVTAGRLAELFGAGQVETDAFIRTLGWRQVAQAEYELLDESSRAGLDAYAEGVNAYLGERTGAGLSFEYTLLGITNPGYDPEPWSAVDSLAWLKAMAWDLRSNLDDELDRAVLATALPPEEVARLHPGYDYQRMPTVTGGAPAAAPAALDAVPLGADATTAAPEGAAPTADDLAAIAARLDSLPQLLGEGGGEIGSNAWVISGAHTVTGEPMLANDPHLGAAMPSVWYQVGLKCDDLDADCRYDVSGYSFAGLPGVIIGHNERIAWGMTNLGPDVMDLYYEHVRGDEYELDGAWVPLTIREETIEVAGGEPVSLRVRSTGRGPIISGEEYATIAGTAEASSDPAARNAVSLQWTALTPGRTAAAIFAVNRARDWDDFRAGVALFEVPAQNLVYADVDGNIGYQAPGTVPVRKQGDGTVPLPGWTSANGWTGTVPFEQLPSTFNPERGYLATANGAPSADGPMLTKDWDLGYRAARIEARIAAQIAEGRNFVLDDLASIQDDTLDQNALAFQPVLAELGGLGEDATAGRELLVDWDAHADADDPAAAYFAVFWRTLLDDLFGGGRLPAGTEPHGGDRWIGVVGGLLADPAASWWTNETIGVASRDEMLAHALDTAWDEASGLLGDDPAGWSWGRLHTLTTTNASFGSSGLAPLEALFNRGPFELDGGSSIVDASGWDVQEGYEATWVPSMRMLVDVGDFDRSRWIDLTGTSGHVFHPHYGDQTADWRDGVTRPWPFSDEDVVSATRQTLVLLPGATLAGDDPGTGAGK
ncbi:penicillin acylase family protein [Agromyces sp. MMS17-SY077]|uniref:Penicillin acylase family protein n=1 Tax=Agromyces seonyuensis TaxID=2662446 RepID=A0A6I4NZ37_9MICO|nr:penicillin acylase family protein [Agromyces seonyuensis]MWB99548.1 penicillin acylase family protein [Agromyces seonyuensis]